MFSIYMSCVDDDGWGHQKKKECFSQKDISSWKTKSSSITKQIQDLYHNSVSRTLKIEDWSLTNSATASFCHLYFKTRKPHKQIYHTTRFQLLPSQRPPTEFRCGHRVVKVCNYMVQLSIQNLNWVLGSFVSTQLLLGSNQNRFVFLHLYAAHLVLCISMA